MSGMQPFSFLFTGKWDASENPLLIEENGFQDIQNMRRDGARMKGVGGHTKISTAAVDATYNRILYGFHFKKTSPAAESHVLAHAFNSDFTGSNVYDFTVNPPGTGTFGATPLLTPVGNNGLNGGFCTWPRGRMAYFDGNTRTLNSWAGTEFEITAFIASTAAIANTTTNPKDLTDNVDDDSTAAAAVIDTVHHYFMVGTSRPISGIKARIYAGNPSTPTLTCKTWDGDSWETLTITDNTNGLNVDGTITWSPAEVVAKVKFIDGYSLYWYQFNMPAGTAQVYWVTALDAGFQAIPNVWDGAYGDVAVFKQYIASGGAGSYKDYTTEVQDDTTTGVADLSSADVANVVYVGSAEPLQGIKIYMEAGQENTTDSVLSVYYWTGSAWAAVSGLADGTSEDGACFAKTGAVTWQPLGVGAEYENQLGDNVTFFYYKFVWSVNLDASCKIYHVKTIPAPQPLKTFRLGGMFQNRALAISEASKDQNKIQYSAENSPEVWNGKDSGVVWIGDNTPIVAVASLYNVYQTDGIHQLIITKRDSTYRLVGDGPDNWKVHQISPNIGCVAARTMRACNVVDVSEGVKRNVIIWQSADGFVMCDGAQIVKISDPIKVYFDPTDSRYIQASKIGFSNAAYDVNTDSYKVLLPSSSNTNRLSVELEFSLKNREWTKLYRENGSGAYPLQSLIPVSDTNGNQFIYGGTSDGYLMRLENGYDWDGTAITQYIHTKDVLLGRAQGVDPLLNHTVIDYMRTIYKAKTGAGAISIQHYCDGVLTADGTNKQDTPADFLMATGFQKTQACHLGECLKHSFKLTYSGTGVPGGMELLGLGVLYTPLQTIMEN